MHKLISIYFLFVSTFLVAQNPRLVLPIGHTGAIHSGSYSPDGKKIITCSEDGTAKLWDAYTGLLLADFIGHVQSVTSAVFSPDGSKIITVSDTSAKIWDVKSATQLLNFKTDWHHFYSAQFSPDGRSVVLTSSDSTRIYSAINGQFIFHLKGQTGGVHASAYYSPDGKKIVTASYSTSAKIWDATTGELLKELNEVSNGITSVGFSHNGNRVFAISMIVYVWNASTGALQSSIRTSYDSDNAETAEFSPDDTKMVITNSWLHSAKIAEVSTGKILIVLAGHNHVVTSANFSRDGKKIVTGCGDGVAKIWDANTGKVLAAFIGHQKGINGVKFSPDGRKIVTFSYDQTAKIWDAQSTLLLADLRGNIPLLKSSLFSPDGKKIVSIFDNFTVNITETNTGKLLAHLTGHTSNITCAEFSEDGKRIVTGSLDATAKIWDAETGILLVEIKEVSWGNFIFSAAFNADGTKIATSSYGTVKIWNAVTGALLKELKMPNKDKVEVVKFSPDGFTIATCSQDLTIKLWSVSQAKILYDFRMGRDGWPTSIAFSADGTKLAAAGKRVGVAKVWNTETGLLQYELTTPLTQDISRIQFSSDNKKIVTCGLDFSYQKMEYDPVARVWDATTGGLLLDLKGHTSDIISVEFSHDGKKILTGSTDGTAKIWDAASGIKLFDLLGHSSYLNSAHFDRDTKKVITASNDLSAKIWDVEKGRLMYSLSAIDTGDYLIQIPLGYYQCSSKAAKLLHYVAKDLTVITFEQLDVKYNRPDKVLEAMGCPDTALISSYRRAYYKRIKKLGIDTVSFREGYQVPEADFMNRATIENESKLGQITLQINGVDTSSKLDRFNIWVNEVPLYGQRGISIRKRNKNRFDTVLTVQLSQGDNRIETSVINVNGTESYRMPLDIKYAPVTTKQAKVYFVGIGIEQFQNKEYNLKYSAKDIRDIAEALNVRYGDALTVDTLFNENVTLNKVKALKRKLLQTTENDIVILSYSGHGLLSKSYDYYLSTYGVDFNKPEVRGIPYDELENLLDSIPARKKLMLIDACHSGEVDKEEGIAMNKVADALGLSKGSKLLEDDRPQTLGLKNTFELMQSLFVNVGKSTGATIISAAAGNQFALERGDLRNGVFTYAILEAMKDSPSMKISELKKKVGLRVEQLTNGLQKPTSRNETVAVDWQVW